MKTMLGVPVIKSDRFGFNAASRTFHAELSDFCGVGMEAQLMAQLYEDACDRGFILESAVTGRKIPFSFTGNKTDHEDEVEYMLYSGVVGFTTYFIKLWND